MIHRCSPSRVFESRRDLIFPSNMRQHPASFRDPSGVVFLVDGVLYRAVAASYQADYDLMMSSGLYAALTEERLLVPHQHADVAVPEGYAFAIIPGVMADITYSYEWSFSQLKDSALLTLGVQATALRHGMTLKDASAYNVGWHEGKPVCIDTLSLVTLKQDAPWQAYGQFCMHFLAPLCLMAYKDLRLQKLLQSNLDGIPLDLASTLLPRTTWLSLGALLHVHLHGQARKRFSSSTRKVDARLSFEAQCRLIEGLRSFVSGLRMPNASTEWGDYYNDTNYTSGQLQQKRDVIAGWLRAAGPSCVCDLGANDGTFSRLAAEVAAKVISIDIDPVAVEKNYLRCKRDGLNAIVPVVQDLTQPSPHLGWQLQERSSLFERFKPDMGLALALVHHLAIGNNTPWAKIFAMLADIAPNWIVEFPDKSDSQVQRLLRNREDIFSGYTRTEFERALSDLFTIRATHPIENTTRTLYWLIRR